MKYYIKELRISHWLKNVLIFFPVFFGQKLTDLKLLFYSMLGFLSFSLLSSAVYILNDIKDVEKDRIHAKKRFRPIAAGKISVKFAYIFSIVLIFLSLLMVLIPTIYKLLSIKVLFVLFSYLGINIFYSIFGWKNLPIIDVILLSSGFLLRLLMGAYLTNIPLSSWLYLVILSGAFYMGFGKRRNELSQNGSSTRSVLQKYNVNFLDKNMYSCMTMAIIFFALWCMEKNAQAQYGNYLILVPILMIILFKYSFDIEGNGCEGGGDPMNVLLKDKWLITLVIATGILMFVILYII